jgi:hypothetical protein
VTATDGNDGTMKNGLVEENYSAEYLRFREL